MGKKFDRDANITFTDVLKVMLARLSDDGTLQGDLKGQSWSMALKGIVEKAPASTAYCETRRLVNRSHFAK